ncbi:MAG: folate hydrolase, partial [Bacteroidetes bacterium]|nr:folate hydrolase [Bacteroidota bacterium]
MQVSRNALATIGALLLSGMVVPSGHELTGFRPDRVEAQLALERRFDAALDAQNLDKWMQRLTSRPQHVGSTHGKENAEFVAELFRSWGYDAQIEVFQVLFPTPAERSLTLLSGGRKWKASLDEPAIKEDKTSSVRKEMLPPYNAYSADGDVTAEIVYVNYGVPDDYDVLERMGIDVKGKIVLARYGRSWRGIKAKVAYEHGAVGCLIYSDPEDDGYVRGDVYPEGPYRNENGAQRGSVEDMPLYPGDPLTPGIGATEDAERLSIEESPTIMKIPVLPISYADAQPLLESLTGPVAPDDFRGGLPITYHIGPGAGQVHLKLRFNWDLAPAYNVIAKIEGSQYPDEWIMRGNHRDAWVFGAADPTSGQVAMLE